MLCSVWLCSCIVKKWKVVLPEEMHKSLSTMATKVYKRNGSKKLQLQSIELHMHHTQHAAKSCADKGCYVILLFPKGGFCSWKG